MTTRTSEPPPESPKTRVERATGSDYHALLKIVVVILVVGAAIRVLSMFRSPVLEGDEAALAINIEHREIVGLLQPLDFNQGAPVGFLLLSKSVVSAIGPTTYSYRLIPLAFSFLALLLVFEVARRSLSIRAAVIALALTSASASLCRYSTYFKQYSGDVAAGLALAWLTTDLLTGRKVLTWRRAVLLAATGCAALLISHPAAFVAAASIGSLILRAGVRRDWQAVPALLFVGVCWALCFAVVYLAFTRYLNDAAYLNEFWAHRMLPYPVTADATAKWLARSLLEVSSVTLGTSLSTVTGLVAAGAAAALAAIGVWRLAAEAPWLVLLWGLTFALPLFAATLHLYPFGDRLILFLVPYSAMLMARGVEFFVRPPKLLWGFVGIATVTLAALSVRLPLPNSENHHWQLLMASKHVAEHIAPADRVFIHYPNRYLAFYYLEKFGVAASAITIGEEPLQHPERIAEQVGSSSVPESGLLWLIFSHRPSGTEVDEREIVANGFRQRCNLRDEQRRFKEVRVVVLACP